MESPYYQIYSEFTGLICRAFALMDPQCVLMWCPFYDAQRHALILLFPNKRATLIDFTFRFIYYLLDANLMLMQQVAKYIHVIQLHKTLN